MTIEVQMLVRRPKGPGEWYEKGVTYPLPDDLADSFVRNGAARRTSVVSELTDYPARLQASGKRYDVQDGLVDPVTFDTDTGGVVGAGDAFLFSELPSAAENVFRVVFVLDIGIHGCQMVSDGTRWRVLGPVVLAREHNRVDASDLTTAEQILFKYRIPGGLLGPASRLMVYPAIAIPNSATTKTLRVNFGSSQPFSKSRTTTTLEVPAVEILTRGYTAQLFPMNGSGGYASGATATIPTGADDIRNDIDVSVTGQWGTAGSGSNVISLHKASIVLEY